MNQLKPPESLDFESRDLSHAWRKWKEEVTPYLDMATEKDDKATKVKIFFIL